MWKTDNLNPKETTQTKEDNYWNKLHFDSFSVKKLKGLLWSSYIKLYKLKAPKILLWSSETRLLSVKQKSCSEIHHQWSSQRWGSLSVCDSSCGKQTENYLTCVSMKIGVHAGRVHRFSRRLVSSVWLYYCLKLNSTLVKHCAQSAL